MKRTTTECEIVPEVGMGATEIIGSDRHPYTIIEVKTPHHIVIQEDTWRITSGSEGDGSAEYDYSPNPVGNKYDVTLRRDGRWKILGGTRLVTIGHRRRYYDPSF